MKNKNNVLIKLTICLSILFLGCNNGSKVSSNIDNKQNNTMASSIEESEYDKGLDIEKTFKDDVLKEYVLNFIDINKDGFLSKNEITSVSEININGHSDEKYKKLKSLDGIELFTELKILTCYECGLNKIDVSKNTKLEELYIGYTEVEELDITNNKELKILDCSSTNINELDVSLNVLLEKISINRTNISNINLQELKNLDFFGCNRTNINELDVSHNKKLCGLEINYTLISNVNLSNNPELNHFTCIGDDNIKDLDLSNNTKLKTLICFESGISELDLSNNPDIYEVECNLDTTIIGGDNIKYLTRY